MNLTKEQAAKIATMMLQAATYNDAFLTLHPIDTQRDGREDVLLAIAEALHNLTGINRSMLYDNLINSNSTNDMVFTLTSESIDAMKAEYQTAPVYQDAKGRQYFMFDGVRTQDFCYQKIDVSRYVDFQPTGSHRNIDNIRKRLQRESDYETLEILEETGEIEDIDPISIQHLYH